MADKTVGMNIRRIREARGMLQKDLATKMGKSKNTISNWELGLRDPGSDNIKKIAAALEISPSELIGHNDGVAQDSTFEIICTDISMYPDIKPGDRLLVDKSHMPSNGDVVVAGMKGLHTAPLVRFYIKVDGMAFLLPTNRTFPCEPVQNFDLLGRVIEVTRKL